MTKEDLALAIAQEISKHPVLNYPAIVQIILDKMKGMSLCHETEV